ncbi:MAG TPA: sugar transferase [Pseudogracilibacillus sp.]|nr:sugar transferase [Pseudogracilibacillus sp.]
MKRLFDFITSFCAILVLIIPMIIIAIVVRIKMGSPVLFAQKRPGLNGKPFHIKKFRTMTDEKDSKGNLLPDEERLTTAGKIIRKLSLDELPQLFNVLKGEMSFVGPRPLLMEYLPLYNEEQARRHNVRPGITGWAQVNGRNAIEWEDKFKLDVWYVDNQSFLLDLKIIWLTIFKVFKSEGVNKEGQATTEKFNGNKEK